MKGEVQKQPILDPIRSINHFVLGGLIFEKHNADLNVQALSWTYLSEQRNKIWPSSFELWFVDATHVMISSQ